MRGRSTSIKAKENLLWEHGSNSAKLSRLQIADFPGVDTSVDAFAAAVGGSLRQFASGCDAAVDAPRIRRVTVGF